MSQYSKTENHICTHLLLLMKQMPIEKIKVKTLVDNAKIGRSTFYLYYNSIYDVLEQLEERFFEGQRAVMEDTCSPITAQGSSDKTLLPPDAFPSFVYIIANGLKYFQTQSLLLCTLYGEYGDIHFQRRMNSQLADVISKRIGIDPCRAETPSHSQRFALTIEFVTTGWMSTVIKWLQMNDPLPSEELAILFYQMLLGALNVCETLPEANDSKTTNTTVSE